MGNNIVKPGKVIMGAVVGTSAMTITSYIFSWISNENFKEPKILSQLITRLSATRKYKTNRVIGWCLHYLVGLLFSELYAQLWEKTPAKANVRNGLILGGISGLAAILIWDLTLSMHPDPPAINFVRFAMQLFVVHVVFGIFTVYGYNLKR